MKMTKLTVFSSLLLSGALFLTSCEREAEEKKTFLYEKKGIVMSGAQETPPVPSTSIGYMDVSYSKETKLLTYRVTWSGLADSVSAMHIHGLSPVSYAAGIVQNIVASSNSIYPQRTAGRLTFNKSGTLSGTLLADGFVVREDHILNGMYYINIHTSVYPGGEIRGQIKFQ